MPRWSSMRTQPGETQDRAQQSPMLTVQAIFCNLELGSAPPHVSTLAVAGSPENSEHSHCALSPRPPKNSCLLSSLGKKITWFAGGVWGCRLLPGGAPLWGFFSLYCKEKVHICCSRLVSSPSGICRVARGGGLSPSPLRPG